MLDQISPSPSSGDHLGHCYRVFRSDGADHLDQVLIVQSPDDCAAIASAQEMLANERWELWDRGRFVARFDPEDPLRGFSLEGPVSFQEEIEIKHSSLGGEVM